MDEKNIKKISKFLSLVLRHEPEKIKLQLDENGWALVKDLLVQSNKHSHSFSQEELEEVVRTNDKQRFTFNADKTKIRANQGHSINIELNLKFKAPPPLLYHGTVAKFLNAIKNEGLQKMSRQYVHLSESLETAEKVGSRRGIPIILKVRSEEMHKDNILFYQSENGVWLTEHVAVKYIDF